MRNETMRFLAVAGVVLASGSALAMRETRLCHDGWSFALDASQTLTAETVSDALPFKGVELPHDWAIAGPWQPDRDGDKLPWQNAVGWYRRDFKLTVEDLRRQTYLDFDGVMAHSTVYLNGVVVGGNDYGYLGFRCDLTPHLRVGENRLLVRVDTLNFRSRWYPGAGIERRVRWVTVDPVRFEQGTLHVMTPDVSSRQATVRVEGRVVSSEEGSESARIVLNLRDPDGRSVARRELVVAVALRSAADFTAELTVENPRLWDLVDPAPLYELEATVAAGSSHDEETVRIGLRTFEFSPGGGFVLNGVRRQLNGVNLHTDMGILGMAFNRGVMRRQLKIMRDMGANAIRTSHNAQSPELLELCDEMGLFVWNECFDKWDDTCGRGNQPLEPFVMRHLRAWALRDRNHPSVFVWSIGNEIVPKGTNTTDKALAGTFRERCGRFREAVREVDVTRPVGIASCEAKQGLAYGDYDLLDIVGFNYSGQYAIFHGGRPKIPVLYSESASCVSSAGYYADTPPTNTLQYAVNEREVDSMDHNATPWSDVPDLEFERMERDRYVGGEFVWTGIDYLGEPYPYVPHHDAEIRKLPPAELARSAYFGICDLLGFPKDRYWLYRSHWRKDAFTLHIAPSHWTFPGREGGNRPVYVYTSAESAELFLNGRSLGRRTKDRSIASEDGASADTPAYFRILDRYRLRWLDVPYEPGELKAVAYGPRGEALGTETLLTAGEPVAVKLASELASLKDDAEEVVFVRISLVDGKGVEVPNRNDFISFALTGPGEILSVGNADPRQTERTFKQIDGHPLYFGRAGLAVRRSKGSTAAITLKAEAAGCRPATCVWPALP